MKVRTVALPPTVTPLRLDALIAPSATDNVTVATPFGSPPNGVPMKAMREALFAVTEKSAGSETVGAPGNGPTTPSSSGGSRPEKSISEASPPLSTTLFTPSVPVKT